MNSKYPLFPELPEEGVKEAQILIERFKRELIKVSEGVLSDLYVNISTHIESDSWTNFRNDLLDGFKNYNNRLIEGEYDFKQIRQAIYKEHKDAIIKDLNQDMVEEIEALKKQIEDLSRINRY